VNAAANAHDCARQSILAQASFGACVETKFVHPTQTLSPGATRTGCPTADLPRLPSESFAAQALQTPAPASAAT
jgi:hypothetical protein